MMLSKYSFPSLIAERERRLVQELERERLRRERAPRRTWSERLAALRTSAPPRRAQPAPHRHAHS